jgi:hypothetical protein
VKVCSKQRNHREFCCLIISKQENKTRKLEFVFNREKQLSDGHLKTKTKKRYKIDLKIHLEKERKRDTQETHIHINI